MCRLQGTGACLWYIRYFNVKNTINYYLSQLITESEIDFKLLFLQYSHRAIVLSPILLFIFLIYFYEILLRKSWCMFNVKKFVYMNSEFRVIIILILN